MSSGVEDSGQILFWFPDMPLSYHRDRTSEFCAILRTIYSIIHLFKRSIVLELYWLVIIMYVAHGYKY